MRPASLVLVGLALAAALSRALAAPFPALGDNPALDLVAYYDPPLRAALAVWYYATPAIAVVLVGSLARSVWRVWLRPRRRAGGRGTLPAWPASPDDPAPSLVVGELHHPTAARESERPGWLVVPEKGLYTGVLIVGAVGSGKTSACMYPFASQLLGWQADRPDRRAAGLVLEVKGDFCHGVRRILKEAGRADDYLEIGLDGRWQWNPLDDPLLDAYSLAYTVSTLINQLFGKSREPFWQQAYTNLVRWIIELHRLLPGGWVTLQDIYRSAIDADLLAKKIEEARALADEVSPARAMITRADLVAHARSIGSRKWTPAGAEGKVATRLDAELADDAQRARDRLRGRPAARGWGRRGPPGPGRGDRALVPARLDGARSEAQDLDRRGDQRVPLSVRPAPGRGRVLSAASRCCRARPGGRRALQCGPGRGLHKRGLYI